MGSFPYSDTDVPPAEVSLLVTSTDDELQIIGGFKGNMLVQLTMAKISGAMAAPMRRISVRFQIRSQICRPNDIIGRTAKFGLIPGLERSPGVTIYVIPAQGVSGEGEDEVHSKREWTCESSWQRSAGGGDRPALAQTKPTRPTAYSTAPTKTTAMRPPPQSLLFVIQSHQAPATPAPRIRPTRDRAARNSRQDRFVSPCGRRQPQRG